MATLVVKNNVLHDNNKIIPNDSNNSNVDTLRTIYPSFNQFKKDDIFWYDQENYKITKKDDNTKNIIKDAILSKINLRDYIETKFKKYLENSIAQVPTGTIINQYCSYEKWCCFNPSSESAWPPDVLGWQGFRPNMIDSNKRFWYR